MIPVFVSSQVHFDFEGSFPELWQQFPPERWEIDNSRPINGAGSLHHSFDNSSESVDNLSLYTGIPDLSQEMEWLFSLRFEGNPSSSNNWMVWLLSELPASGFFEGGSNSGLMIGVNQTSSNDSLSLYGMIAGDIFEIGVADFFMEEIPDDSYIRFQISLDTEGVLRVYAGSNPEPGKLVGVYDVSGLEFLNAGFFGISYRYTSSRDRLLWLDDLVVNASFVIDESPPELEFLSFPDPRSVTLSFHESLQSISPISFFSETLPPLLSLELFSEDIILRFTDSLSRGITYDFRLSGITDHAGNRVEIRDSFRFFIPRRHEILFSEILPDPSPRVYLPECEFLELYNGTDLIVNSSGWELRAGSKSYPLPSFLIPPGAFKLLISSVCGDLYPEAVVITDAESFLANSGSLLVLSNQSGVILDALRYHEYSWGDPNKKEGGWSLERTDLRNLCGGEEIWQASQSLTGGTPGMENSWELVVSDRTGPVPLGIYYVDSLSYRIEFNEELDTSGVKDGLSLSGLDRGSYEFEFLPPFFTEVLVHLSNPFTEFHGRVSNMLTDCQGNGSPFKDTLIFKKPERPEYLDVIITEIMFDPIVSGIEFLEIYNRSDKVISVDEFLLQVNTDEKEGRMISLGEERFLIFPHHYLVLAENLRGIDAAYPHHEHRWVFSPEAFPSLPDGGAQIRLYDKGEVLLDEVNYDRSGHFPFLESSDGVSLERVLLDKQPGIHSAWVSASWDSGGATPGYQNSQHLPLSQSESSFHVEYPLFTPDNDGERDFAVFRYSLGKGKYTASFMIFNARGQRLFLQTGINPGSSGTLVWNGEDLSGRMCPSGIYLGYFECLDTGQGEVLRFKEAITLSR